MKGKRSFLKRITAILLIAVLAFSFAACQKSNNNPSSGTDVTQDANHNFSYTETDNYLLKDGATEYKIVIPSGSVSTELSVARDELVRLFKEATGVALQVVTDAGLTHSSDNKYISLGNTTVYKTCGLNADTSALKKDGARILTKDKTIFFIGKTDNGVLYGVYDFLNMHFNFETYFKDTYTLDTGVRNLKLMNYDVTDIPDIEYRTKKGINVATTAEVNDTMFAYRMRTLDSYNDMFLPIHSGSDKTSSWKVDHNSFYFLPKEDYFESNRNFYSTDGLQLCFTAHGDTDDFNLMVDLCAEKITNSLRWYDPINYPNYTAVELGINDFFALCHCNK